MPGEQKYTSVEVLVTKRPLGPHITNETGRVKLCLTPVRLDPLVAQAFATRLALFSIQLDVTLLAVRVPVVDEVWSRERVFLAF